jgi:hypothetical protein
MKIAIMQPYFFPYIGYFQLVNAVDKFVFYDDVNFITRGWINRNRILCHGKDMLITVPLKNASQNKLINEIKIVEDERWKQKLLKTLEMNYKKAPYFSEVYAIFQNVIKCDTTFISEMCINSVMAVSHYLGLSTIFEKSSEKYPDTRGLKREQRLIEICQKNNAKNYINPSGGKELYKKEDFLRQNLYLFFIENTLPTYRQFNHDFVPGLSIIDVMMFNSPEEIKKMSNQYKLV